LRINRYLAASGMGSRRAVEDLIRDGRVTVDGETIKSLGVQVGDNTLVEVDGEPVHPPAEQRVVLLNKPRNIMTTRVDPQGRKTVYHLLPDEFGRLAYAGRLDYPSRGLLVLTDDGELLHRLTHPRWEHPKRYEIEIDGPLSEADIARIREGGMLLPDEDDPLRPVEIETSGNFATLVLREGRYRQIRRMMEVLGRNVLDLCRTAVGEWTLEGLEEEGQWRELSEAELEPMRRKLSLPPRGS
jgi:23S rRNA pseudouridine2605 synthase